MEGLALDKSFEEFYSSSLYLFDISFPLVILNKNSNSSNWVNKEVRASQNALKDLHWNTRSSDNNLIKRQYSKAKGKHK